jgi:aryl-alcohol dehydrogenase-like predicted oxidoreductase
MRRRSLGKTGIQIPELCLGTWGLSGDAYGAVPDPEQDQVIERALALGLKAFETADAYAEGGMETRLGKLLEPHPDAIVMTKVGTDRSATPPVKRFGAAYLRDAALRSQARLKRAIDVLLLHNPSSVALAKAETRDALSKLRDEGIIRAWGASVGDAHSGNAAIDHGAEVVQLAFNAFHPQDLDALLANAKQQQVGLLVRSVLAHGLLCGQWPTTKSFASGDHRRERWTVDELKKRISQLSALRPSVNGPVNSLRALALRYALAEEAVSSVVIGPKSTLQLDQLVRDAGKEPPYLAPENKTALERRLANVGITRALSSIGTKS